MAVLCPRAWAFERRITFGPFGGIFCRVLIDPKRSLENNKDGEHMSGYVVVLIYLLSVGVCAWIAKARHVRAGFLWTAVVVILGPFAIPLIFLAKPQE